MDAKIKAATLFSVLDAAKNTYPNEFMAMLASSGKNNLIDEFVIIPAVYGKQHVIFQPYLMPVDSTIIGSIHSHPSPNNSPSREDIKSFAMMGKIHLITAFPFNLSTTKAYDKNGKPQKIGVIE